MKSLGKRALRFMRRKFHLVSGPRVSSSQSFSDATFLGLFEFSLDGDGVASNNRHTSAELLGYFERRIGSGWPAVPNVLTDLRIDLAKMTEAELVEKADAALDGHFHPSGVLPRMLEGGRIDWSVNPSGSREWLLMLHRHSWWALWARAYQIRGDERYAKAFVAQLEDWIERHPLPAQKAEGHEPWRLMEAGLRIRLSWIPAMGCFFNSPEFNDNAKLKMLRALYDHGQFLNQFFTNRNHLVRESNGLVSLALQFPEFVASTEWLANGLRRLDTELAEQLNQDGSHIEMSVGYQWLTIDEFEVTKTLLDQHDQALPNNDLDRSLRQMYAFVAAVIRPDRSFPQINDGFILWGAERLERAGRDFHWPDIEFIGSGGVSGTEPPACSQSFPNAGVHVMRSDWSDDARYLIADSGPYGGPHGHEDKLSFEIFAHGVPFLVDPGSYTYQKDDPYRNYFVSSASHNTMLVDGKSQVRRWNASHMTPVVQNGNHGFWISDDNFDFVSAYYNEAYAKFSLQEPAGVTLITDVIQQRDFLFVKPNYWILIDHIDAARTHDYEFLFHAAPDISVESRTTSDVQLTSNQNGARLNIEPICDVPLTSEIIIGSESPIQGWYSADHHKKCPAPTVVYSARQAQSMCVAWMLYPQRSGQESKPVRLEQLACDAPGELKFVVHGDRTETISVRSPTFKSESDATPKGSRLTVARNGKDYVFENPKGLKVPC